MTALVIVICLPVFGPHHWRKPTVITVDPHTVQGPSRKWMVYSDWVTLGGFNMGMLANLCYFQA